jgi:citrate lyase subunit beta / citryl-CoA lyase
MHKISDELSVLDALLGSSSKMRVLPVCDHYSGTEKTMFKSLSLQNEYGPLVDITLDFEDGTSNGHESHQRDLIKTVLNSCNNIHDRIGVRIHGVDTNHWQCDIDAVVAPATKLPAFINIPKVENIAQVILVEKYLKQRLSVCNFNVSIPLHVMVENVKAVSSINELLGSNKIECASFGLLDFVSSFGGTISTAAIQSPGQFDHPLIRDAKLKLVMSCYMHDVVPSHSISIDVSDPERTFSDAKRALKEFAYLRMWSIHPSQISPILRAFEFEITELEEAVSILEQAAKSNWSPISYNKTMHDMASYRIYWLKLKRAILGGKLLPNNFFLPLVKNLSA